MSTALAILALAASFSPPDQENGLRGSVCPVGDVDGDGAADFALARRGWGPVASMTAPGPEHGGPGIVWIVSGKTGRVLRALEPEKDEDLGFGRVLEAAGDLDGDRKGDVLVAGDHFVWAWSSATGEMLHRWRRPGSSTDFGLTLSAGGDVDGDSVPDVAIFLRERSTSGETPVVAVYSGRTGDLIRSFAATSAGDSHVDLGERELQPALTLVGDRDGDGRADLALVVASGGDESVPALLVVSSRDGTVLYRAPLAQSDSDPWLIRELGDIDGDGKPELLASFVNVRVAVLSGDDGDLLREYRYVGGYLNGEGTGLSVVDDIDGDGASDYLIAANEDGFDCDAGFAFVYSGKSGKLLVGRHFTLEGSCGAGVDACAIGDVDGDSVTDFVLHMPRLREAWVVSGAEFSKVLTKLDLRAAPYAD